ncbi:MAG: twin-arginine translocase TatA/TatE family subunit [Candidatus Korobacteraceae bacterium]|jgi:sec-independent protein translocase protein TatB
MPDILFIVLLALVFFGPKKLPEIARQVGKYLAQFRQVKGELMEQISSEVRSLEQQEHIEAEPVTGSQITKTVASAEPEALSG